MELIDALDACGARPRYVLRGNRLVFFCCLFRGPDFVELSWQVLILLPEKDCSDGDLAVGAPLLGLLHPGGRPRLVAGPLRARLR